MTNPTNIMLTGLAAAYVVGGLPVPAAVPLGLATLSIAVPVALRECGRLRDHDELQLRGQRRGAVWAFVLILALAPLYVSLTEGRDAFAGRGLEAAVSLFALVYLVQTQGTARGARTLLWIAAGLAVAYGLSHLPDLDKLAAMAVVAAGFAALGYVAGRAPRAAGGVILVLAVVRAAVLWLRADPDRIVLLPTAVFSLAMAVLLLRGPENPAED